MSRVLTDSFTTDSIWADPFAAGESALRQGLRFLAVLGAHVVVIGGGLELASRPEVREAVEKIYVRLVELPPPPPAQPVAQVAKPVPVQRKVVIRKPEPPPPVLSAAAEAPVASSFTVPPQPPAPPAPAPIQPAPPAPQPVTAARFDADYLQNPKPVYPRISRRLAEEGTVVLRVRVSAEGAAMTVELRKSSGYARLDDSAMDAVKRWRFLPARQGNEAIASWVAVPIAFKLEQ